MDGRIERERVNEEGRLLMVVLRGGEEGTGKEEEARRSMVVVDADGLPTHLRRLGL